MSLSLCAAATFLGFHSNQWHDQYLRSSVGHSVVQVLRVDSRGGGTGFGIEAASGKNFIATNAHVCELGRNGWLLVKSDHGFRAFKKIVYIDNQHDICLIDGDRRIPALKIGSAPEKGEHMYIVGHPGLRQLTLSKGEFIGMDTVQLAKRVEKEEDCAGEIYHLNPLEQLFFGAPMACIISYPTYATTAVVYGGNSGSPAVNKWGNVIGILFAGNREQERDNHVVPLSHLKRVLKLF